MSSCTTTHCPNRLNNKRRTAVAKLAEATSKDAILHQAVTGSSSNSSTGTVTKAWIKERAVAATASAAASDIPLDSLAYVAYARLAAGPISITLYEVVSSLLRAHSIDSAECLPGMVKL